jgi:hypothetical protein
MTGNDFPSATGHLCLPERSTTERNIAALVFIGSLLYLYLFRLYTMMDPDEGIILQGAERILHGQTPYRDFFSFYTPGSYYLTAALFKLLGDSLPVARTALAAAGSVISALTYLVARRVCSRGVALLAAALTTLTCLPYRFLVLHNWDSTLWAMLALYSAVRYVEEPRGRRALALGSLASVTILFEQSKGAGLVLGLATGLGLLALASRRGGRRPGESAEDEAPRPAHLVAMAAGCAWPFLIVFAWFAHERALTPMLADWLWPLHHYSRANSVPYGYQNWSDASRATILSSQGWGPRLLTLLMLAPCFLVPVMPLVGAGVLARLSLRAVHASRAGRAKALGSRSRHYLLVSAVLTGLLVSVLAVRPDIIHFMYLAPFFYLVLAWILDGHDVPSSLFCKLRGALRVLIVVCFALFAATLALRDLTAGVPIQTRRGAVRAPAPDQVLDEVQPELRAGSSMLVYPYLPLYYYLTATFAPGSYDFVQPGMHTPAQLAEAVDSLAANRTPVALYEYEFAEKIPNAWPHTPIGVIARDPVGDYLIAHYASCGVLKSAAGWRFLFMVRKDLKCPANTP